MSVRRDIMSLLAGIGATALVLTSIRGYCDVFHAIEGAVKSPSLAQHATGDMRARAVVIPDPPGKLSNPASVELTPLEAAIVQVESGGDLRAVGDGGKAIGPYQMWEIMVEETNRINGLQGDPVRFTNKDRTSLEKSTAMFRIYQTYWLTKRPVPGMSEDEVMARRWNGGCKGETKTATDAYWEKVQAELHSGE